MLEERSLSFTVSRLHHFHGSLIYQRQITSARSAIPRVCVFIFYSETSDTSCVCCTLVFPPHLCPPFRPNTLARHSPPSTLGIPCEPVLRAALHSSIPSSDKRSHEPLDLGAGTQTLVPGSSKDSPLLSHLQSRVLTEKGR